MNAGIISSRYAKALLMLVDETGRGEEVYRQVEEILKNPDSVPPVLEPELSKLVTLLVKNNRMEYARPILHRFMVLYDESRGRRHVTLRTAAPAPEMEQKIKEMLHERLGGDIVIESEVDPSLIGGFTLTVDDKLLDASVSRQLEEVRRQLMAKNKRIV